MDSEFVAGVGDLQLIGRGATSSVFLGRRTDTGETVVVKVLGIRLTSPEQVSRFEHDLDAVMAVSDERGIAPVWSRGVNASGHPWFTTEYLPDNLRTALETSGRLPWAEAVVVGAQIADALAAAHRRRILHGDLKPSDIRLDDLGIARLADLGLARFAGTGSNSPESAAARMAHCAPEVAAGRRVDERTDLYSLASVLYEAIAGTPPFGRLADLGAPTLMERILTAPATSLAAFGVPKALDDLLLAALSKDPSLRPAGAAAFADALAATTRRGHSVNVAPTTGMEPQAASPERTGERSGRNTAAASATSPLGIDDIPFDELATPAEGYPIVEEFPVLDAVEAAPLLAAAGRRERRRRRERRVLAAVIGIAVTGGATAGIWWLVTDRDDDQLTNRAVSTSVTPTTEVLVPSTDSLRPVGTVTYAFTAAFDIARGESTLTGIASPTGEARLKNVLLSVGRVENLLQIEDGPEPDGGAAVDDAVTLLATMRKDLTAGTLRFDGQVFSVSGFYANPSAEANLRQVISLLRTPVSRPSLQPAEGSPATPPTDPTPITVDGVITVDSTTTTFVIPADGRFHIRPLTLTPEGGSTRLCLASRTVSSGDERYLTMNHSGCGLAHIVTLSSTVRGTYVVTDTFVDERGITGPRATVTFTVVVN